MTQAFEDDIKSTVREHYAKVAESNGAVGCAPGCCAPGAAAKSASQALGYSADELGAVPEGADMGLGCGNPQVMAGPWFVQRKVDLST